MNTWYNDATTRFNLNKPVGSYRVTINREGDQWVARDESSTKRSWGNAVSGLDESRPREVAEYLFHASEIERVELCGTGIVVHIFEY